MPGYLESALPSIVSGIVLMVIGGVVGWVCNKYKGYKQDHETIQKLEEDISTFMEEHRVVMLAVKNINRATIIDMCDRAIRRGYISDNHFKCLCELEESYHMLHGNSYTDEIIEKTKALYQRQSIIPTMNVITAGKDDSDVRGN